MTLFEQYLLDTVQFFEDRKVDVFLHGSTLLRIIRDGTVNPRPDVVQDKELNIGILQKDFTPDLIGEIAKHFAWMEKPSDNYLLSYALYYGPKRRGGRQIWNTKRFVYLVPYLIGKTKAIEYMGMEKCKVFPKKYFERKNWRTVTYLKKKFYTPMNPKEYLTMYFGDWEHEHKQWKWQDSPILRDWSTVKGGTL